MAIQQIRIPDFGDVQKITVVEIFVAPGDTIALEASLIALESEKAVMDIPSPFAGTIKEVLVKADDLVKSGDLIVLIETADSDSAAVVLEQQAETVLQNSEPAKAQSPSATSHATPSVRAFAREQGVDLAGIIGTGSAGRILREDVLAVVASQEKQQIGPEERLQAAAPGASLEDYSKFGPIEEVALSRIQKISGPHLHKSWTTIPHVTHSDQADITELEKFRKELNGSLRDGEVAFSPLIFIIKAVAATLKIYPTLNSSLLSTGDKIVLKKYYHLGIAVDTPDGLVVPVLRDADKRGFREIAGELQRLSSSARSGKATIVDMQGATFTISSLGGIGGSGFTPIISLPQVAILGLSRSTMQPVWDGEQFVPRLLLPFSLSYDHRVIDGATAARFCRTLSQNIEDLKRVML